MVLQSYELIQRDKRTISEHVRNIFFEEDELIKAVVVRKSRITAANVVELTRPDGEGRHG